MAELRIANFDADLMRRIKMEAVRSDQTIKEFVTLLLTEALRCKEGRKK